jgi:hypothetical protein
MNVQSIVVVPKDVAIIRHVFDATWIVDAKIELLKAIEQVPLRTDEVPEIYARQRGIRLSKIYPRNAINVIADQLNWLTGMRCDLNRSAGKSNDPKEDIRLGWHQDVAGMAIEEGEEAVVAWVPLDPIDGSRPSLEIGPSSYGWPHIRDEHRFLVLEKEPIGLSGTVVQGLDRGDVVLFSPYTFHRTYVNESMTETRLSLDMRFYGSVKAA